MQKITNKNKVSLFGPQNFSFNHQELQALKGQLEADGVTHCFAIYTDIHGVPKSKTNPISAFEKMAYGSELFTVGAMDGMGLVGPQEDECAAVPDLNTLIRLPWDKTKAFFFGDLYYHGMPYQNDTRQILKRQLKLAEGKGYRFNLGFEPEFYVFRKREFQNELKPLAEHRFQSICPAYDVHQTLQSFEFLEEMSSCLEQLGWGLFSFDQEGGHGQFEFDCQYSDALSMCDRFIFFRLMARLVAEKHACMASFMPKPFANDFRSGNHFNMSLEDLATGQNLFVMEPEGNEFAERYGIPMSKKGYHFVAGLLRHAPSIVAVCCPTYNSYQGLLAQGHMPDISWAPVLIAYGRNNRSAMIRIPLNRSCVENRVPDISVNPYLAAALQLAAGFDGIEMELDPGEPLNENCYNLGMTELRRRGISLIPRTLLHALEAFEADSLVTDTFGAEFQRIYFEWKMREWNEGFYDINPEHRLKRLNFI